MTGRPKDRTKASPEPARRLRSNSGEHTRTRLLDVARETAARMPYSEITVEHLTVPAKISRATFYLYFRNKTDIYLTLTAEAGAALAAAAEGWSQEADGPQAQIEEAIHRYLQAFVANLGPLRLLYAVAPADERFDAILRELTTAFTGCVERRLRDGQARGEFRADFEPAEATEALWAMIEGFCHRQLLPAPGVSFGGPKLARSARLLADLSYRAIAA